MFSVQPKFNQYWYFIQSWPILAYNFFFYYVSYYSFFQDLSWMFSHHFFDETILFLRDINNLEFSFFHLFLKLVLLYSGGYAFIEYKSLKLRHFFVVQ